ncbi:MAG: phosphatidylglycerophosphatase A [Pirellulales bacterium]|nr:phosphatidylglycerophosphatase A [Pirellulales bacterium]
MKLSVLICTGFGLGLITKAPGTVGTAVWGLPLAWAVGMLPGVGWQVAVIALLFAVGVPLATAAGKALGGGKDHQAIIWDEIVSLPIVFLAVPLANWRVALAGLLLHRLFDITKPPPARQLEELPEGLGVMADDVMAALYAALVLAGLALLCRESNWPLFA